MTRERGREKERDEIRQKRTDKIKNNNNNYKK